MHHHSWPAPDLAISTSWEIATAFPMAQNAAAANAIQLVHELLQEGEPAAMPTASNPGAMDAPMHAQVQVQIPHVQVPQVPQVVIEGIIEGALAPRRAAVMPEDEPPPAWDADKLVGVPVVPVPPLAA